jgi:hypothetical protein
VSEQTWFRLARARIALAMWGYGRPRGAASPERESHWPCGDMAAPAFKPNGRGRSGLCTFPRQEYIYSFLFGKHHVMPMRRQDTRLGCLLVEMAEAWPLAAAWRYRGTADGSADPVKELELQPKSLET